MRSIFLAGAVLLHGMAIGCSGAGNSSSTGGVTVATPAFSTTAAQNGAVILAMSTTNRRGKGAIHDRRVHPHLFFPELSGADAHRFESDHQAIGTTPGLTSSSVATWAPSTTIASGTLVWSDEFNNSTSANAEPNPTVWGYDTGASGWGNSELEHYCSWDSSASPCDPTKPNAYVGTDGYLHIASRQPSPGVYTSARLKSEGMFSILYGRIEAKILVPEAQGFWPAFWMLGNNIATDGWPASGELDIQERVNAASSIDWNMGSVHGTGFFGTNNFQTGQTAAGWHTYGMICPVISG